MGGKATWYDRRRTKDIFGLVFIWLNIAAFAGLIISLYIFYRAQPEFETVFDRFYHLDLRVWWDHKYVQFLIYVSGAGTLINAVTLWLSMFRGRRRTDHRNLIIFLTLLYALLFIFSNFLP